jgi:N-acetylglutamate synthase and related acetyltransferases
VTTPHDHGVSIVELSGSDVEEAVDELAQLLLDAHESGMALGLAGPLDRDRAAAEWLATAALLDPRNRVMLGAHADGSLVGRAEGFLVGTVQIVRSSAGNGLHRAEIVRLAVRRDMRGRGIGRALLEAATERARELDISLLWLTTHADTDSDRIYERLGWTRMGTMPGYAARPDGTVVANVFYYLELSPAAAG